MSGTPASASGERAWRRWSAPILLGALALRLLWPLADPPARLSWSNGIYTDPATMVHAARNAALFGEWIRDYNRDLFVFPLANLLTFLVYSVFGPGRLPAQVLSAILGTITVGAVGWALRRAAGPRAAVIGVLIGAVSFWQLQFSRIPVGENAAVALMALAGVAVLGRKKRALFLAGLLSSAAVLFGKYHAIGLLPALALLVTLRSRSVRAPAILASGGVVALAAWVVAIWLPQHEHIAGHVARQSTGLHGPMPFAESIREGLGEFLNTLRRAWLFYRMPVEATLGGLFAFWTLGNTAARRRRTEDGTALFAFWFLGMWFYYALLPYKAPRYFVLLTPALVGAAAIQIEIMLRSRDIRLRAPSTWDTLAPLALWIYCFSFGMLDTLKHYASMSLEYLTIPPSRITQEVFQSVVGVFQRIDTFHQGLAWAGGISIVLFLLALWSPEILTRVLRRSDRVPGRVLNRAARVAVGLAVAVGLGQYAWWATHRTTFIHDVMETMPAMIGDDAVVLGPMAPLLFQDTKCQILPYFGPMGERGMLSRHGVTHVLVCGSGDERNLDDRYPRLRDELAMVQSWPVSTLFSSTLALYRLPAAVEGVPIHDYRPTLFEEGAAAVVAEKWDAALEKFAQYRASGGEDLPEIFAMKAICLWNLGDLDKAGELLEEAIRLRPKDPLGYQNLGALALKRGDRSRALELWMSALRLDRENKDLQEKVVELSR
ncbi:MAG: glycosyltransferase family 39 protein [Gemmatimonadota bacterium]|nr:glycosyltransferase family 39 protein [Gemmatimonadota bacterium]MDP6803487.1 glycosyltransferase family 39 protein [Gemmatimonadota bacterium]MDP7031708.1 glycosyltransferase family 39 protein [Gemmatimonadota bacterium]